MIIVLVSHYLTNKLIMRRPFPKRCKALTLRPYAVLDTISGAYASLWGTFLRVTQPSAARVLLKEALPHDLHVLSTPPAFILSQDQTLHKKESVFLANQSNVFT